MHSKLNDSSQTHPTNLARQLEDDIFQYLRVKHQAIDITIGHDNRQSIHCVVVNCRGSDYGVPDNYFVGHGFGGSSLMNFAILQPLLQKGNVVLWEVRGMGFSQKLQKYQSNSLESIEQFFLQTITALLEHFCPKSATFICHSFSAYITFKFLIKNPSLAKEHIKEVVLLSPIGITPLEQDYKSHINSCSDLFHFLLSKFGWAFKVTYKSLLRTACSCLKSYFVNRYLREIELNEQEKQLMTKIISTLIQSEDGSDLLFFDYFHPRVLPKVALQHLLVEEPEVKVTMVFGGKTDWVDLQGPSRIANRYPNKIKLLRLQECGHNIMFQTSKCLSLFDELFK